MMQNQFSLHSLFLPFLPHLIQFLHWGTAELFDISLIPLLLQLFTQLSLQILLLFFLMSSIVAYTVTLFFKSLIN